MEAFVTYCSREKDHLPEAMPALRRYKSARIERVKMLADSRGVAFCVLSGKFGLVKPDECIPDYDHLLVRAEVDDLAAKVADQLTREDLTKVTFFISSIRSSQVDPYEETMKRACHSAGVTFNLETLETTDMADWQKAMAEARAAKMILLKDRVGGEKRFEEVLQRQGEDGMIYFIRGEGYESLGDKEQALNDYRLAEILFPLPKYKAQARDAAARVEAALPSPRKGASAETELEKVLRSVADEDIVKAVRDSVRQVETDPGAAVRGVGERGVRGLIMYLEGRNQLELLGSWAQRTRRLVEKGIISQIAAYEMDAVREIRNKVVNERAAVTRLDAEASVKMFVAALGNIFGS